MLTAEFLREFKKTTEASWNVHEIRRDLYGYQIQRGTRWNPGLSKEALIEYQRAVGFEFADDLKAFLREMNGTDLPTLNVYGECSEPYRTSVGVYSFPRDLRVVQRLIKDVKESRSEIVAALTDQGFKLADDANLMPIYGRRYVVCTRDLGSTTVLSIQAQDTDAIVYGNSLQEYLENEFLRRTT